MRQDKLAAYYRDATVGLITPLRDGMNLVAKVGFLLRDKINLVFKEGLLLKDIMDLVSKI